MTFLRMAVGYKRRRLNLKILLLILTGLMLALVPHGQMFASEAEEIGDPRDKEGHMLSRTLALKRGHNLVMWTGSNNVAIQEAISGIKYAVEAVYSWDHEAQEWLTYHSDLPHMANSLKTLNFAQGVWIIMNKDASWKQPAPKKKSKTQAPVVSYD